jgi:hypothetical protein
MNFQGEITGIKSSRGKKVMTVALSSGTSLDALDNYSGQLCDFEVGLKVEEDGVEVDAITGEVVG